MSEVVENKALKKKVVMSGMRPTNRLHMGNYFGALKNFVKLQDEFECYFSIADWHAMTNNYKTPKDIQANIRDIMADWIAWGVDYEKHTVFVQSAVPEILEVHMIFSNLTPMGWLERVTTWKDAQEELEGRDARNLGRFAYPVLQTADIVSVGGQFVPVGQDQLAHLELSREIVRRFNHLYKGKLFEPQPLVTETPYVVGVDGRKMSKSYGNTLPLTPDEAELKQVVKMMVTDPARVRRTDPGNPEICPLFNFHKLFSNDEDRAWVTQGCTTAGIGCGDCKNKLSTNINAFVAEAREKKKELLNNPNRLDEIIRFGNEKAQKRVRQMLERMKGYMS